MKLVEILSNIGNSRDLHESCMELLDYFRIQYVKISPARLPVDAFLKPEFISGHQELVKKIKEVAVVGMATEDTFLNRANSDETYDEMERKLDDGHYRDMAFFSIDASASMTRTEIALLTRALNRRMLSRPCVLFLRNDKLLTMATCEKTQYIRTGMQGERVGKVTILRNINCEKPHRGHVDILDSLDITRCQTFDDVYLKWLETFSNELLTKKFYQELSDWYAWAVQTVRFPNDINDDTDDAKYNTESTIRMVTRLIFVWFLKEKHLIPEEFFDVKYLQENLLVNFDPYNANDNLFGKSLESRYYKAILQNLFFAMLNCPIANENSTDPDARRFSNKNSNDHGNNKLLRYKDYFANPDLFIQLANAKVPFLNGGLFDCLDDKDNGIYYDGFSDSEKIRSSLCVPDYLFFGEEVGKAIDLSEYYGDINKKKVSARGIIDILKRYNFTIEENTPFEQEVSLDPELLGKVFENLLASYNPETRTTARNATGSFYTPREVVQYMVDESLVEYLNTKVSADQEGLYRELLSYSVENVAYTESQQKEIMKALYNCKVLDPACGSGAFPVGMLQQMVHVLSRIDPTNEAWKDLMIENALRESKDAFETESEEERRQKLLDIENAFNEGLNYPDYARKLYLIENCIYGVDIQPIAIQISHLRFFISLIVNQKENTDPMKNFGIRPLPNLEAKFVAANSIIPLDRNDDLFTSQEEVKAIEKELHLANHKIFSAKTPRTKRKWREESARLRQLMADTLLSLGAINNASQLASWDMFDQNSHASFFDPEWMFGIHNQFDITIGNPPWIESAALNPQDKNAYERIYSSVAVKQYDIFCLFIVRCLEILNRKGVLCFITPNRFLTNKSYLATRKYILENSRLVEIDDLGDGVFENVSMPSAITILRNEKVEEYSVRCREGFDNAFNNKGIASLIQGSDLMFSIYGSVAEDNIVSLMQRDAKPLGEYLDNARGVECGKKASVVKYAPSSKTRRFLRGEDIGKYFVGDGVFIELGDPTVKYKDDSLYRGEKILIRKTGLGINAVIDYEYRYFLQCIYSFKPKPSCDLSLEYLLGCLNSKLMAFYYFNVYGEKDRKTFPHLVQSKVLELPVRAISKSKQAEIAKLVSRILELNGSEDTSELERKIDDLVYDAYGIIDPADISIIESSLGL